MSSATSEPKENADANSKWLEAHYDPLANLYTFSSCIGKTRRASGLGYCSSGGELPCPGTGVLVIEPRVPCQLVVGDLGTGVYNMKLKVYRGTSLVSENTLLDLPTGLVAFLMDQHEPRTPAVAVASGPFIYIYKNLRPYFKFTLPPLEVNALEQEVWSQAREDKIDPMSLKEMLEGIREKADVPLSVRSLKESTKPKYCIELSSHPVGLVRVGKNVVVGCTQETLHGFTQKGKKLWTAYLPAPITTMSLMDHHARGFQAVLVGLTNCQVHMYCDKNLVGVIKTPDMVTSICFGRYGREDGALIMTTKETISQQVTGLAAPVSSSPPERGSASLARARACRLCSPVPCRPPPQVQGLGPSFKLTLNIQNTAACRPVMNLAVSFLYDESLYSMKSAFFKVRARPAPIRSRRYSSRLLSSKPWTVSQHFLLLPRQFCVLFFGVSLNAFVSEQPCK
nr:PREDICTED: Bardet-Biedl syndrome 1 protein [Lepisosteus oculatus]